MEVLRNILLNVTTCSTELLYYISVNTVCKNCNIPSNKTAMKYETEVGK